MVRVEGNTINAIPVKEVAGKVKRVEKEHTLVVHGKKMGVYFGE
jgi:6-phosphofructokinase 1